MTVRHPSRSFAPARLTARSRLLAVAVCAALLPVLVALPGARAHAAAPAPRWLTTWAPSPVPAGTGDAYLTASMPSSQAVNQTVRMVVRTTSPGGRVRLRLTNRYGTRPVSFGPVRVGLRFAGPSVSSGSSRLVLFGGRASVTVGPRADTVSDPVVFGVAAGTQLVVSLRVIGNSGPVTWHRWANAVTYVSAPGTGDRTGDESGASFGAVGMSWLWLDGLDTESTYPGTMVVLGDSISDGWEVLPDQYQTWPDVLASRLEGSAWPRAVVNAGIAGNTVTGPWTCGMCGPSALTRIDHDAFSLAGVTGLFMFEGTNDLAAGRSASAVISGLARLVSLARARGLRVYAATITPRADVGWRPAMEFEREAVNHWIRTGGMFNAVFDFDAALRDPIAPHRLLAAYDSGDSLHPNLLGLKTLGDSIDLSRLR